MQHQIQICSLLAFSTVLGKLILFIYFYINIIRTNTSYISLLCLFLSYSSLIRRPTILAIVSIHFSPSKIKP